MMTNCTPENRIAQSPRGFQFHTRFFRRDGWFSLRDAFSHLQPRAGINPRATPTKSVQTDSPANSWRSSTASRTCI